MPDLTALLAELGELHRRAEAQLAHREPILASRQWWTAMTAGLRDTDGLLRTAAGQMQPGWQDVAGQDYVERMDGSAAVVRSWAETVAGSGVEGSMTALAAEIDVTVARIRQLRQVADGLVGQLAAIAGPFPDPVAGEMAILAGMYHGQLERTVAEARAAMAALDQVFADTARVVAGTPAGVAWDGPAGTGGAATAMAGAAPGSATGLAAGAAGTGPPPAGADLTVAGSGAAGTVPAGAGPAGGAEPLAAAAALPVGAGTPDAAGGPVDPTGLAGSAAPPAPITGLSPGVVGPAGSVGVPAPPAGSAGPIPVIPPAGRPPVAGPVSSPLAPRPVLPGTDGASAGGWGGRAAGPGSVPRVGVADTGATAIPRAAAPTGAVPPAGAGAPPATGTTGSAVPAATGPTGAGYVRPPLGMVPSLGAGLGAGRGTPAPGTADEQTHGHRNRPLRTVPGVPPRIGGRSGSLTGPLPFARTAAGPPQDEDAGQVLDDELWQVRRADPDRNPPAVGHRGDGGTT